MHGRLTCVAIITRQRHRCFSARLSVSEVHLSSSHSRTTAADVHLTALSVAAAVQLHPPVIHQTTRNILPANGFLAIFP